MNENKTALIFGATGNIGGAAARELLARGWQIRAVTRNPQSEKARALAGLGAQLVQADMDDRASLEAVFASLAPGARLFSVQNWATSGVAGEERQAKLVADLAQAAQVGHLVYGSAGVGVGGTGIPHFENKVAIEAYMRDELGLPMTAVRPAPFMELLTQKEFFPPLGAWGTMPQIVGWDLPLPWIAVHDLGVAIANIFEQPDAWIGRDINLIGEVQSMRACREIFKRVNGRKPFRVPLPPAVFAKMAGPEMVEMWRWIVVWCANGGAAQLARDLAATRELCPQPLSVAQWLRSAGRSLLFPKLG